MKTLLLSSDDIQNFNKIIYDPKTTQLTSGEIDNSINQTSSCNLMALQYYLKHPNNNYPASPQAQLLTQTSQQTQFKQVHLKQPTIHSSQHSNYHHHHPYYQQTVHTTPAPAHTHSHSHSHSHSQTIAHNHSHTPHNHNIHNHSLFVHALNQNSNFSAASSSTGGGTASSHAPTQQSNTTGSSLSPPGVTANARNTPAKAASNNATVASAQARSNTVSNTKKLKVEPILSQAFQTERFNFANSHLVWNEEHWKRVIFQDERKFNLDGPDGFTYYFHDLRNYERSLSQRPRGNSVFIYLLVTSGGPIHMEVSSAKQRPEASVEIIVRERANIVSKLTTNNADIVLQDHNWSGFVTPSAKEWLSAEGIKLQRWPTIAHDVNIMENIWGWLIREVYDSGRKFSRRDDLIFRIREAWARLPMDLITNLYSTLPERVSELYYTRGIYTNC